MQTAADTSTNAPRKATRREWIGLFVLALPSLLVAMDATVLYLAVPAISADLHPTSSELLWIVDSYGFLIAGSLITMGTLGDRIGRRRLLLWGAVAFGIVSTLTAFATSAEMLIVTRALLGIAGATLMPSTLSLISHMFEDPRQRATAIGVWVTSLSAGSAIGPLLGGLLLETFWWGSVFLLALPVMALLLAVGPRLLPEYRDPGAGRLDVRSAALSLVAVLAIVYGIKRSAEHGLDLVPVLSIVAGLALGVVFARRQSTLADPLIDIKLFRVPAFSAALATNVFGLFVIFAAFLFIGQYLQLVLNMGAFEAGLYMVPSVVAFIVGSTAAPALARYIRPGYVMAAGFVLAAVGFAVMAQVSGSDGLVAIVAGDAIMSLGLAPVITLATDMVVGSAPRERAGAASAISETSTELGGALGVAILGSIGTAIYRGQVADAVPAEVPAEAAHAARDTLGGAIGAADQLPATLLQAATDAFASGFQAVAAASVLLMVGMAVVSALLLREAGGSSAEADQAAAEPRSTTTRPPSSSLALDSIG